jgi:hypothetical protein
VNAEHIRCLRRVRGVIAQAVNCNEGKWRFDHMQRKFEEGPSSDLEITEPQSRVQIGYKQGAQYGGMCSFKGLRVNAGYSEGSYFDSGRA